MCPPVFCHPDAPRPGLRAVRLLRRGVTLLLATIALTAQAFTLDDAAQIARTRSAQPFDASYL